MPECFSRSGSVIVCHRCLQSGPVHRLLMLRDEWHRAMGYGAVSLPFFQYGSSFASDSLRFVFVEPDPGIGKFMVGRFGLSLNLKDS